MFLAKFIASLRETNVSTVPKPNVLYQAFEADWCYNSFMEKFSERLKELRLEKRLSQQQLAKETGISQNVIMRWETQKCKPRSINAVIKLAKFFEVKADYLLGMLD